MPRAIVRYGSPMLHQPASPVPDVTEEIRLLVDEMIQAMHAAPGIGLAASQIGVPLRVCVIDLSLGQRRSELVSLINPSFVSREGMQLEEEGCLSLPGFNATVPRPRRVVVRGWDGDARERVIEGTGLLARALQHEMDHLDGLLFTDRVRAIKRRVILRKIGKLERAGRW